MLIRERDRVADSTPQDEDSQWLLLHALFASALHGAAPGATPEGRTRFAAPASRYVEVGGRGYLTSSSAFP